ncbi:hypothetical protein BASA84_000738 [Batrachochytrium salamandrivorans]|nr:hypothetical protein BASA84_000738 [Batrachochytrium salamandrivorans]
MLIELPIEVQQLIFEYLTVGDLLLLSQVCQHVRCLSMSHNAWKSATLVIGGDAFQPSVTMINSTSRDRNTISMGKQTLRNTSEATLLTLASYLYHVRDFTTAPYYDIRDHTSIWSFLPSLSRVDLSQNRHITDTCIDALAKNCRLICSLSLRQCSGVTDKSVYLISRHLKYLEHLDLSYTRCTTKSVLYLLSYQDRLKTLSLESCLWIDWNLLLVSQQGIAVNTRYLSALGLARNTLITGRTLREFARLRAGLISTSPLEDPSSKGIYGAKSLGIDVRYCEDVTVADVEYVTHRVCSRLKVAHNALMQDESKESIHAYLRMICGQ